MEDLKKVAEALANTPIKKEPTKEWKEISFSAQSINIKSTPTITEEEKQEKINTETCKCGTIPQAGMTFYMRSKYNTNGDYQSGIINEVFVGYIRTINTTVYNKSEIEIYTREMRRDMKLIDLGL